MAFGLQRSLTARFEEIDIALATMGGHVEQQLSDAITVFDRRDTALANDVIRRDVETDARERSVERAVIELMEDRRLPPTELRRAMTVVKIAGQMERIGDLSKNIAKRTRAVAADDQRGLTREAAAPVVRMGVIALAQVSGSLDALFRSDAQAARAVREGDDRIDDLFNSVFTGILDVMAREAALVSACTQLVFIAKNFERVGDHATNIAERVHYALTGEELTEERRKSDVTSSMTVAAE
jgi:phosphate transport system protein